MFAIKAKKRSEDESLDSLRKVGEMPAVFYGAGQSSTPVSVSMADFKKVWRDAGESSAVKLNVDGKDIDVLIHEVQLHPVTEAPLHVDFLAIDMNKKIKVKVPVEFVGVSPLVKGGLGNLVKVLQEVEVEALPKDLPHSLSADISKLATLQDNLLVSDISLPSGVSMITGLGEVVASVVAQVEEKEEVAAPVDLSAIEVEKKGKKEEEGTATEPSAESKS